jgi:hypothetical protein
MFVSQHYAEKVWTIHERRSVLERALQEKGGEYILPARFGDTPIPGLRSTLGYIDLRKKTPRTTRGSHHAEARLASVRNGRRCLAG